METATAEQTLVAAHDGVEAIVLDTGSNGMNGWELLPQLRKSNPEAHTPVILLNLDTQQNTAEVLRNSNVKLGSTRALISELVRSLGAASEHARILVVESSEQMALLVGEAFSGDGATVRMARSREQAMDECLSFHPHLLVLNIVLPDSEALNLVGWLRDREILANLVLVAYSGRELMATGAKFGMEPAALLKRARVQPEQLEQLVLTILRGARHIESTQEVSDVSGVAGD